MIWIQSLFDSIPTAWAIIALVAFIGLSVLFLRGLIRLAMRAFFIGLIGLAVLGVVYFLF
jgi:ABC-type uncharacterized transport system permease subunit